MTYEAITYEEQRHLAHLVAQAHGLYLRLRDRMGVDRSCYPLVKRAYERYRRRVALLPTLDVPHDPAMWYKGDFWPPRPCEISHATSVESQR